MKKDPKLARLCALITGDGHIQSKGWRHMVSFYSKNTNEIGEMARMFQEKFDISGRIYVDHRYGRTRYKVFFISKEVTKILLDLGVPKGNKTNTPFRVPLWVRRGSASTKAAYLQGILDAEGSIYATRTKNGKPRWRIGIEMYKNEVIKKSGVDYITDLKRMLESLGIRCSPVRFGRMNLRIDGSYSIAVKLNIESSQFLEFHRKIGFQHEKKVNLMNDWISRQAPESF